MLYIKINKSNLLTTKNFWIQEQSTRTSYNEEDICEISYPFAKLLSEEIHQTSPNSKIQWYQSWGRPNGDEERCDEIPQVCTFDGM